MEKQRYWFQIWLLGALLLILPAARAQFRFSTYNGGVAITGYTGTSRTVAIPGTLGGFPVTSIGGNAFASFGNPITTITNLTMPNSVTNIGWYAFQDCQFLSSLNLSTNLIGIGGHAFEGCSSLPTLALPNSVNSIGINAFSSCMSLTNFILPDSVSNIGDYTFYNCTHITNLTIGTNVSGIGNYAFSGCSRLPRFAIPASVSSIGVSPFLACTNLASITVDPQNPYYSDLNGVLFDEYQTTLVTYPAGIAGAYSIPDSVTNIAEDAFADCSQLTGITIPNGVTMIGAAAFSACSKLPSLEIPASVTNIGPGFVNSCTKLSTISVDTNNPAYAVNKNSKILTS